MKYLFGLNVIERDNPLSIENENIGVPEGW
jgi:hypothetical protein